jgi:hypothetical protein
MKGIAYRMYSLGLFIPAVLLLAASPAFSQGANANHLLQKS